MKLSEADAVAAQLAALGVEGIEFGPPDDAIFDAYVHLMKEHGRFVTAMEVARHIGRPYSTVAHCCTQMAENGRLLKTVNPQSGKTAYVPVVK